MLQTIRYIWKLKNTIQVPGRDRSNNITTIRIIIILLILCNKELAFGDYELMRTRNNVIETTVDNDQEQQRWKNSRSEKTLCC